MLTVPALQVQEQSGFEVQRQFTGKVEAARTSRTGFELSGIIARALAEEGEPVEAGQVIAELDKARLQAQRAQLSASLEEAQASERLAEATLQRLERARKSNAVSSQQVDEARQQAEAARATIKRIVAQRDLIDVDLVKSTLRAPFRGTIARRYFDEGSIVTPGQPVFDILETSRLQVRAGLSAEAANQLQPGQRMELDAVQESAIRVEVARILPQRNTQTRTVDVIFEVTRGSQHLRDGDLIEIPLPTYYESPGFWLPRTSLTEGNRGLWACFVLQPGIAGGKERVLERRQLELLHATAEEVYVRGPLQSGDQVVAAGLHRLVPNQHVLPQPHALAKVRD